MAIDPNILNIILGLITNALTSLLVSSSKKAEEIIIGKDLLNLKEEEKSALMPILRLAVKEVAEEGEWSGKTREEIVSLFLFSPEFVARSVRLWVHLSFCVCV